MPKGFGTAHFGSSFFGYGEPDQGISPPPNLPQARYIDPDTRDFVLQDDGSFAEMPGTRQRVYLALATQLGSAAGFETLGSTLHQMGSVDSSFSLRVEAAVRKALTQLTTVEKVISITSVDTQIVDNAQILLTVSYLDLVAQSPDNLSLLF